MSHELPILNQVRIESPCPASWDEMTGDEKSRHCDSCEKKVFHLSNMTAREAAGVVQEHAGNLCVRIRVRSSDGSIITTDDAPHRSSMRRWLKRAVTTAASIPLLLFAAGCSKDQAPGFISHWFDDEESRTLTGDMVPVEDELMGVVALPSQPEPEVMGKLVNPEEQVPSVDSPSE